MRFYTVTQLGKHTALTPEGYLLAEGVTVARCGQQIYHHSELPLEPNGDGFVSVNRDPSEVFKPDSVASFNGKPIVNDHPMDEVGPGNWNNLAIGLMINPRRGSGADNDVLLADLLFTTPVGIQLVKSGKRAVSVGYDAHYDQIAPGMGAQKNIVCNHLALVDVARCGPRCTIMDGGAAIYNDTWKPKPPVYQRGMDILRKLLPVAWSKDVDYRQHEPIDYEPGPAWNDDDWNEALHPRVPSGSGHGGEFTSGGGGGGISITSGLPSGGFATGSATATAAQSVPTPKAAVVQKHGGSKKLAALVKQHLQMGEDPHTTAEAIKAYGNAYVNAGYASYANALLKHVEEAHGMPTGSLGKSKAALPTGMAKGGGPPPMGMPTAAEMQAMAEADEPNPEMEEEQAEEEKAALAEAKFQAAEASYAQTETQTKQVENTLAGKNAAGTNPDLLEAIANDPTALDHLSDSAHKLGINVMGHPTAEAKAAKSEISTWTDPAGYKMIQNHLNGTKTSPEAAAVADKLQKAVLSTELLSSVNTYRGVHGPQLAKLQSMMPGDTWTPPGFSATTLDPKRATHYAKGGHGGDLMHIVLPKGSKALYVSNPALNSHTAEREMLLPAGSTFKYVGALTIDLPHYDYSGNKVGNGGPVTVHQVEVMQPGSPEFEAAHPRGEGGKFVAKPGTEAEEAAHAPPTEGLPQATTQSQSGVSQIFNKADWTNEQKIAAIQVKLDNFSHEPNIEYAEKALQILKSGAQPAALPEKLPAMQGVDILADNPGLSPADKIAAIKTYMTTAQSLAPEEAHEYAQAKLTELYAQQKAEETAAAPKLTGHKVPASAVLGIMGQQIPITEQIDKLKELKTAAIGHGHDVTEVNEGLKQLQEEHEKAIPMPDGSAVQQELWDVAAEQGLKHQNKITQLQVEIENLTDGSPTKEYGKKLIAHLKGEPYVPPAPKGPDPHPDSKGQQAIYEYATHPDPGVTVAEKIAGIESVMAHVNAGPMTKAFGAQWITALGGDPSAPDYAALAAKQAAATPALAAAPVTGKPPTAKNTKITNVHGRAAKPATNIIRGNPKLERIKNAYDWEAKAKQPKSTSTTEAQEIAPSIKHGFWTNVASSTKTSITHYGGSDYWDINGALRGDSSYPMTPKVQKQVNDIDALFYHDDCVTNEHMIVRRGEATPAADIAKWKAELAKGDKACLNTRHGYTSASVADASAFSSKPVQWHFVVPKGTRILGIAGTVGHHENEILFPHGQQTEIYEMWEADGQQHIKAILR